MSLLSLTDWDNNQFVAADVETSGTKKEYALQPWRLLQGTAWLTSFACVWREPGETKAFGGLFPDLLMIREFLEWVVKEGRIVVGWNVVFDIQWFLALGFRDLVYQIRWLDGMLIWRHLDIEPEYDISRRNKKSYSLKIAVPEFLPQYAGYQTDIDYHGTDPVELEKLHRYNIKDNLYTLRIAKMLYKRLGKKQRQAMWMETRCLPMIAEANLRGLLVDTIVSKELSAKLIATSKARLASLSPFGVTEAVVRSPVQLAALMYDKWLLPVLKQTKTSTGKVNRSTDKEVLWELALMDPRAKELREYRESLNNKTKFADRLQQAVTYNEDGMAHPQARVFGTYTGRITISSKQNATEIVVKQTRKGPIERQRKIDLPIGWAQHQMKRDKDFRKQIIAPVGYDMVEFDAAGQEFKWMAAASMDKVMLKLCLPGEDPHSYMVAEIYRENYRQIMALVKSEDKPTLKKRVLGKIANFSLAYRTSAKRLRVTARVDYDVPMTQPEADLIWNTYQRTYKDVPQFWGNQIARVKALGYAETFAGRRVKVVGDWSTMGWAMGSTAINYRIQGTGADQKYLAMSLLRDKLIEYDGYFAFDLHDGMYSFVPEGKSEKFISVVKPLLDDLPYGPAWGYIPPIPMTWDCKIGKSWGTLKGHD
jgi:DNA polymerase I-like protein with 3'-5' exonuclease and polymerase domains